MVKSLHDELLFVAGAGFAAVGAVATVGILITSVVTGAIGAANAEKNQK